MRTLAKIWLTTLGVGAVSVVAYVAYYNPDIRNVLLFLTVTIAAMVILDITQ